MNLFKQCYELAENGKCEPFWNDVYQKAFPNMTNHMRGKQHASASQYNGVDRIIYLENGKTLTIDEKVRSKDYDDILLEFISNDQKNTPGWIEKDLSIDYLAYAFLPSKTAYLFDWRMLALAWAQNKEAWKDNYKIAKAENLHYTTHSVCVPIREIRLRCANVSIIRL